jgi:hypothetical protein
LPFIAPNGTAAAPSLTFTGGTNVGLYFNGLGQTGVASSGVPVLSLGTAIKARSDATFNWISTTGDVASVAADTGLARSAAGVVKVTNGSTGDGSLRTADGLQATPAYGFSGAAGLGLWRSAANVVLSTTNDNSGVFFAPGGVAVNSGFYFRSPSVGLELNIGTPYIALNDALLIRDATGVTRFGAGGAPTAPGLGYSIGGQVVEANAATKAPTIVESGELYTNTGDGDGSIINLPNDPTIGTQFRVALTVAQTVTINAATGESIQDGATNAASRAASAIGDTIHLIAVTGGSGAVWMVVSKTGTWS